MKTTGQRGECTSNTGFPNPSNCKSTCINRIDEKTARRDVDMAFPELLENLKIAKSENQLLIAADLEQQIRSHISRFDDLAVKWRSAPEFVQVLGDNFV